MSGMDFAFHIIDFYRYYINNKWEYSLYKPVRNDIEFDVFRYRIPAKFKTIYHKDRSEKLFYRDVIEDYYCDIITDELIDDDIFNEKSVLIYRDHKGMNHRTVMFTAMDNESTPSNIIIGSNSRYTQKP